MGSDKTNNSDEGRNDLDALLRRLVERAKAGEQEAIAELFKLYEEKLMAMVRNKLGDKLHGQMESVDLSQSVWKDVLKGFKDFEYRGPESFLGWLATLSTRKVQAKGRYYSASKRDPDKVNPIRREESTSEGVTLPPAPDPTPSKIAMSREEQENFMRILNDFPEIQRQVLIYRMRDELEYEEIARIVGKSPDATKKIYARSLKKLLQHMMEERRRKQGKDT